MAKKKTQNEIKEKPEAVASDSTNPQMDRLQARRKFLLSQGRQKEAEKIQGQIDKSLTKNPMNGVDLARDEADKELGIETKVNRPNQETIGGSRQYVTNPDGSVTVKDSLDQGQQELYNQDIANKSAANKAFMQGLQGRQWGQGVDMGALPAAPNSTDLLGNRQRIEDSVYKSATRYVDEDMAKEKAAIEQQMFETGNAPGSPQYEQAMRRFDRKYEDIKGGARNQAIAQGGQEWQRDFDIGMTGRQNAFAEQFQNNNQAFGQVQGLGAMGGGITTMPNFFGFQPIDYNAPNIGEFLNLTLSNNQANADLRLKQQALAKSGGGGGGGSSSNGVIFSNSYPDAGFTVNQPGVSNTANNFINGMVTGGTLGVMRQ